MNCLRINAWIFIALLVINLALSSSIVKRDTVDIEQQQIEQIDPVEQAELNEDAFGGDAGDRGDREKRLGLKLGVVKGIGLKAVLLNLIFGKIDSFIDSKTRFINELDKQNIIKNQKYFGITPPPKRPPSHGVGIFAFKKNLLTQALGLNSLGGTSSLSGGGGGGFNLASLASLSGGLSGSSGANGSNGSSSSSSSSSASSSADSYE